MRQPLSVIPKQASRQAKFQLIFTTYAPYLLAKLLASIVVGHLFDGTVLISMGHYYQ